MKKEAKRRRRKKNDSDDDEEDDDDESGSAAPRDVEGSGAGASDAGPSQDPATHWKGPAPKIDEDKSKDEEFEDYLEDLFMQRSTVSVLLDNFASFSVRQLFNYEVPVSVMDLGGLGDGLEGDKELQGEFSQLKYRNYTLYCGVFKKKFRRDK